MVHWLSPALFVAFGSSTGRLDRPRPRSHQSGLCSSHRQISLRFSAAMFSSDTGTGDLSWARHARGWASSRSLWRISPISRTLRAGTAIMSARGFSASQLTRFVHWTLSPYVPRVTDKNLPAPNNKEVESVRANPTSALGGAYEERNRSLPSAGTLPLV